MNESAALNNAAEDFAPRVSGEVLDVLRTEPQTVSQIYQSLAGVRTRRQIQESLSFLVRSRLVGQNQVRGFANSEEVPYFIIGWEPTPQAVKQEGSSDAI